MGKIKHMPCILHFLEIRDHKFKDVTSEISTRLSACFIPCSASSTVQYIPIKNNFHASMKQI